MPGTIRLNIKEANHLADVIEGEGGNADSLKAAIDNVKNGHSPSSAGKVSDEEHILEIRSKSTIEHGEDLECMICHQKFDELISGTCEACFRKWALATKRKRRTIELL